MSRKRPPPTPDFVLRSHTTDATALCFCQGISRLPITSLKETTNDNDDDNNDNKDDDDDAEADAKADDLSRIKGCNTRDSSELVSTLVSGASNGTLKFWDLESRRVVLNLDEHAGKGVLNIEWTGTHLVTQGRDGFIKTWELCGYLDLQKGLILSARCTGAVEIGSYTFTRVALVHERPSLLVAPARNDAFFEMWNLNSGHALVGHCVGRTAEVGGKTGMVMSLKLVWCELEMMDAVTGALHRREVVSAVVGVESGEVGLFVDVLSACLPEGERILIHEDEVENKDESSKVVEGEQGEHSESENEVHQGYERSVAAAMLGLTGDNATWTCLHTEPVLCLDVRADPNDRSQWFGISGSADTDIGVFYVDAATGCFVSSTKIAIKERGIADLKIRSDGKIFVTAGWDGLIRVFGVKKLRPLAILNYHHDVSLHAITFGDVERGCLCSAGKDGKIAWWSIYPNK